MNNVERILLRRKNIIWQHDTSAMAAESPQKAMIVAVIKNLEGLGYTAGRNLIEYMSTMDKRSLTVFYNDLVTEIKALIGADKTYKVMYPNFPSQVMEATDAELFFNAMIHYWSGGKLLPAYKEDPRFLCFDNPKLKVLSVGGKKDLMWIFSNILSGNTNISDRDKEDIITIISETEDWIYNVPNEIPIKENCALFGKAVIENKPIFMDILKPYFNTATDVLRLVVALSNGDLSLAKNTRFRKLKRAERRLIMDMLVNCGNIEEDMFRYQNVWIRLGEVIHPGEFAKKNAKYKDVFKVFTDLRTGNKPQFFGAKVHAALNAEDMARAAKILKGRPGEFARLLDKLIRDAENPDSIITEFASVADKVSSAVLWQVESHFRWRRDSADDEYRVFFIKGKSTPTVIDNELAPISKKWCDKVISVCEAALTKIYFQREKLGNVFISEEMDNYVIPYNQRTASAGSKIITRGSRFDIREEAKVIRSFIWWTNQGDRRIDIDLSVSIYNANWEIVSHVSYTKLRDSKFNVSHSGDIVDGGPEDGDGVSEFVDIDIDSIAANARYAVIQVYSFCGIPFSEMKNCNFGWMEREDVDSGEIYEPKTVEMNMRLASESSTMVLPAIIDCKERKIIWMDMSQMGKYHYFGNNLESNVSNVNFACYAIEHMVKPTMYDIAFMNAISRGNITYNRDEADLIFDVAKSDTEEGVEIITPFDVDDWMALI